MTNLFLHFKTLLMLCHCTHWSRFLVTLSLRHLDLHLLTLVDSDVGALLLVQLLGDGDDDVPGHVHALLPGCWSAHSLLDWSIHCLLHCSTSLNLNTVISIHGHSNDDILLTIGGSS